LRLYDQNFVYISQFPIHGTEPASRCADLSSSSISGPDNLSTLFSNILSLCSSLSVRDQDSHPYKTTGEIMVLNIFMFKVL